MKIVRPGPLMEELGVNRHGLKIMRQQRGFPNPIKLGERSVGYLRDEVDAWIEKQKAARGAVAAE